MSVEEEEEEKNYEKVFNSYLKKNIISCANVVSSIISLLAVVLVYIYRRRRVCF